MGREALESSYTVLQTVAIPSQLSTRFAFRDFVEATKKPDVALLLQHRVFVKRYEFSMSQSQHKNAPELAAVAGLAYPCSFDLVNLIALNFHCSIFWRRGGELD